MNAGIAPPLLSEKRDLRLVHRGRLMRQARGEVAQRADPRLQVGLPVVMRGVLRQLLGCALGTEVVCMRVNSVMAVVRARDDDGEKLALGP